MTFRLNAPTQFRDNPQVSLAFGIRTTSVDSNQRHVVLIYRRHDGVLAQIHMGWHHQVFHELWSEQDHWVSFEALDLDTQETLADYAVLVASNANLYRRIPYSIVFSPGPHFDINGNYLNAEDGTGLTCATFLLSICEDFGIPLINCLSWPVRTSDQSGIDRLLIFLNQTYQKLKLPLGPVKFQEANRTVVPRYRPEEIAVTAYLYNGVPLEFSEVCPVGEVLVQQLHNN